MDWILIQENEDTLVKTIDHDQFQINPDQLAKLEKRSKLNRFLPSCFSGTTTQVVTGVITGDGGDDDLRLHMMDNDLEIVHRGVMARTMNKYLVMEAATCTDKIFTASLIVLTMLAILVLFWFQNFGPGFKFKHVDHTNKIWK